MRRLDFGQYPGVPEQVLRMISANMPNGSMCSGLRELTWAAKPRTLPFFRLFLSPHLTKFSLTYTTRDTHDARPSIASAILELEALPLRHFSLAWYVGKTTRQLFESGLPSVLFSAVSSTVLRCGNSLTTLLIPAPLLNTAIQHVMRLPKLTTWAAWNGPPMVPALSLSDAFPQLETLDLYTNESLQWLPLFEATARHTSSGQASHLSSHRGPGQGLISLTSWVGVSVNTAFISPIMLFHGLVNLSLKSSCSSTGGCTFCLTDGDMAEVTAALPHLGDARFGDVCSTNTCRTTVSSLHHFSSRCKSLGFLQIHFNTANLRDDLERLSIDPQLHDTDSALRRPVVLLLSKAPVSIGEGDIGPVLTGLLKIFPSLNNIQGDGARWRELNSRLRNGRETPEFV